MNLTSIDLNSLRVFETVAATMSFTAAAARLGLDKSRVSRVISSLEATLRTPLFTRSTRSMRLTPEGAALLRRVSEPLTALAEAVSAQQTSDEPSGEVVIATTPEVARALLPSALSAFRLRHPTIRLHLRVSPALEELSEIDIAIRVGQSAPSSWLRTRLRELESGFFASPGYLERKGEPRNVEELAQHEGLWPIPPRGTKSFSPAQARAPKPPAISCGDFEVLSSLAQAGAGIALLPTFLTTSAVENGRLMRVLPSVTMGSAPLVMLTRGQRSLPARVKVLRDHLRLALRPSVALRTSRADDR